LLQLFKNTGFCGFEQPYKGVGLWVGLSIY